MLEEKIDQLIVSIEKLTAAIEAGQATPAKAIPKKEKGGKKEKTTAVTEKPATENIDKPAEEPATEEIDQPKVKEAIIDAAAAHGREPVSAVLKKFGASKLSEIKEKDYADVVKALTELDDE